MDESYLLAERLKDPVQKARFQTAFKKFAEKYRK